MEILLNLANDKVINVRLVLAELVKKHILQNGSLSKQEDFLKLRDQLASDKNEEVRSIF